MLCGLSISLPMLIFYRVVQGAMGAVMATLVQTQTAVHYAHLAEMVTPSSQLGQLVSQLQALLMQTGAGASAAYAAVIQAISGIIEEGATILAMQDAFLLSLVLNCIAIVAAFFVRFRNPQTIPA
jgi:MFS family permease